MSAGHDRWSDAAGAYVLGAMAPAEREEFEGHLSTCATCRREVDELRPAAEALPMASPPMVPPPALKDRIMAEVEREAALLAQTGAGADRPAERAARRRRFFPSLGLWRLAPVAAALLIAGVLIGTQLGGGTKEIGFDRAGATLKVEGDQATLVADDLPAPPSGRVYEVWVVPKGSKTAKPTNALFTPRSDGSAEAAIPGDPSDMKQVLVSDEPPGGSDTPTGDILMSADVS
jgi:anti-sigma-K factor RskA